MVWTDRRVRDVINHYTKSASRGLSERRVSVPELLDQESIFTENVGCILRAHERGDRIGLQ